MPEPTNQELLAEMKKMDMRWDKRFEELMTNVGQLITDAVSDLGRGISDSVRRSEFNLLKRDVEALKHRVYKT